jgi:acyl-CoA thioester hydrolase
MVGIPYEVATDIQVRWRDLDALGHVNNAVYLSYLETARVAYFKALLGDVKPTDFTIIIARIEIDYLAPVSLTDEPECQITISSIGRKSFDFSYLLKSRQSGLKLATARSVQVCYDYKLGKSVPISEFFWQRIQKLRKDNGLGVLERR